jgi:hypothetical protein
VTPAEVAATFPPIPDDLAERIAALMVAEQAA